MITSKVVTILSMGNNATKDIKVPLSSNEIAILQATWEKVKENWLRIFLVAFEK